MIFKAERLVRQTQKTPPTRRQAAANFRLQNENCPAETLACFVVLVPRRPDDRPFMQMNCRTLTMLPTEAAYDRYLAGEITYEEYRRLHAEPENHLRLARMRRSQQSMVRGAKQALVLD